MFVQYFCIYLMIYYFAIYSELLNKEPFWLKLLLLEDFFACVRLLMMMILGASHVLLGLIMLLCANVAEGQPGGVGLFAMAGLVLPAQAMQPAPAAPEPWRPPMPPTVPLGRLVATGGHRVGIPMGFSDGLNLEENEKVVWHWPLILVALASSGILSKKCSEMDLSPAGSAPALGKQWTCCQAAISAFVGIRMQALKYMHSVSKSTNRGSPAVTM